MTKESRVLSWSEQVAALPRGEAVVEAIVDYDADSEEAILRITDGQHRVRVFAHPLRTRVGTAAFQLLGLDSGVVRARRGATESIRNLGKWVYETSGRRKWRSLFAVRGIGRLICLSPALVRIGGIQIIVEDLPGDLRLNELVEVDAERVDFIDLSEEQ